MKSVIREFTDELAHFAERMRVYIKELINIKAVLCDCKLYAEEDSVTFYSGISQLTDSLVQVTRAMCRLRNELTALADDAGEPAEGNGNTLAMHSFSMGLALLKEESHRIVGTVEGVEAAFCNMMRLENSTIAAMVKLMQLLKRESRLLDDLCEAALMWAEGFADTIPKAE